MATVYDTPGGKLISKAAEDLKGKIKKPTWADSVKTGPNRMRMPDSPDWYYHRTASVLRKIYLKGPIGVQKLRVMYGSKKSRGHKPEEFRKSGGKAIRSVLIELDKLGFTEKFERNGRRITSKGRSYLDKIASSLKNG